MAGELLFTGTNRRRDLGRLKRAYDEVASAAEALKDGRTVSGPAHRVVLIEAERGLGKTRLAMELYRHLSTACDPAHYWPDGYERLAEDVAVMPRAETCGFRAPPPFLWWGMQVADGPNPGNTVFASLEDLLPHLVAARAAARREGSTREFLADMADLAVDVGIEVGPEIAGLGMAKRIGQSLFKIGGIVRRHAGDETPAIEAGRERVDSVTDAVLADLARLFDPRSRTFAGIPLVVLVDDAQFADRDPAMAAFLEWLIARGARDRWPVLVLLTHWSRQMGAWEDASGKRQQPSRVARVLRHAREGRETEPGPFAKEGGGTLPEGAFVHMDLGEPVDDLATPLRARFPGLAAADVAAIADKAGGNPRKLEQIVARMGRKPRWFEGGDLVGGLAETGREAVLALADLPIEEVVLERFADTPAEVRRAVMLASLVGSRFVVGLVDRLSRAQRMAAARDGLEDGERRYRFVRGVLDRSRDDIADFAERLFVEAAREYRESGLAGQDLPDWPEDAALLGALDRLLGDLVADPGAFEDLGTDDLAEALTLAATRMETAGKPAAGLALARLVDLETERGNPDGAYEAAVRFAAGFEADGWSIEDIPAFLADGIAQALLRLGRSDDASRIQNALYAVLMTQAAADPANLDAQHNLMVSLERLGDLHAARGEADAALKRHQECYRIRSRLTSADPSNAAWQWDLSVSLSKLGDLHAARGEADAALERYQEAHAILESLVATNPSNTDWQRGLSISFERLGDLHAARDEANAAFQRNREGYGIRARLVATDPHNATWQRELSVGLNKLGDLFIVCGETTAALKFYREGYAILERLVAADPANAGWQRDLVASHVRLAATGSAAEVHYAAALATAETLQAQNRLSPQDAGMVEDLRRKLRASSE